MGKKPVLGLAGLCVGLALSSGCKDCTGWWSSRKETGPAQARLKRSTVKDDGKEVSTWQRPRSVSDTGVATRGGDPSRVKTTGYDLPVDSYQVPRPANEGEVATK